MWRAKKSTFRDVVLRHVRRRIRACTDRYDIRKESSVTDAGDPGEDVTKPLSSGLRHMHNRPSTFSEQQFAVGARSTLSAKSRPSVALPSTEAAVTTDDRQRNGELREGINSARMNQYHAVADTENWARNFESKPITSAKDAVVASYVFLASSFLHKH